MTRTARIIIARVLAFAFLTSVMVSAPHEDPRRTVALNINHLAFGGHQ